MLSTDRRHYVPRSTPGLTTVVPEVGVRSDDERDDSREEHEDVVAYQDAPQSIPGTAATISAPHMQYDTPLSSEKEESNLTYKCILVIGIE